MMNTVGFIRAYMAKNQTAEQYVTFVARCIEKQLQEWDDHYKVKVLHRQDYTIIIQNKQLYTMISLTESELVSLHSRSPYTLDRHIWEEMQKNGIEIKEAKGNYFSYVWM